MSWKQLFISALSGYLSYQFWKAYDARQVEKGKLKDAIPGLQPTT